MFPEQKIKKSWFGKKTENFGWEDLGEVGIELSVEGGKTIRSQDSHTYCSLPLHIGKENGELFKFCPRCMIKTKSK